MFDVLRGRLLGNHNDFQPMAILATRVQRFFHLFFFLTSTVPQVKNCLFPTKPLPLCKPLRFVQFSQESCPAGE